MIRRATPDDAEQVLALEAALFGSDAWTSVDVGGSWDWWLAEQAEGGLSPEVAGYVATSVIDEVADLLRIGVLPSQQRAGLGTALLDQAVTDAVAQGATRMLLEVSAANAGALAFYHRHGFAEIDVRRRYYTDGSDAIVMERPLRTTA